MRFSDRVRNFLEGKIFTAIVFLMAVLFVVFEVEAYGAIALMYVSAVMFIFLDNLIVPIYPLLLASAFVIKCYDSASVFIPLWYLGIFPVCSIVYYLVKNRRRFTLGKSFYGILAVSIAVTLGGLFEIRKEEYFGGASLYYVLGLGFGMLLLYLVFRAQSVENDRYSIYEKYTDILCIVGAFASFVVFEYYMRNFEWKLLEFQWSNNIATILMFVMPVSLYKAQKNKFYLALFLLNYFAIFLSKSRGGIAMGTLELLICIFVCVVTLENKKLKRVLLFFGGIAVTVGIGFAGYKLFLSDGIKYVTHDEARIKLIARSFEDFAKNPLFGVGVGNVDNSDLYNGKVGTMCWYHMMIPQIVGSFGAVGIYCYGKQIVERFAMAFKNATPYSVALGLSYLGMFLMSQVNPGEFCPLPYELLVVINFIMIEKYNEKKVAQLPFLYFF